MKQPCSRWGCKEKATYDKPLCYEHWQEWDAWELEECSRCHWFIGSEDTLVYDEAGYFEKYPYMCDNCLALTLMEKGKDKPWVGCSPEKRAVASHATIKRHRHFIYILKLSDATYYIGQTTDLIVRIREHKDGQQKQTKGKNPKLVMFTVVEGMRDYADDLENELILLNRTGAGRRRIRKMIEEFRTYAKMLDLDA